MGNIEIGLEVGGPIRLPAVTTVIRWPYISVSGISLFSLHLTLKR